MSETIGSHLRALLPESKKGKTERQKKLDEDKATLERWIDWEADHIVRDTERDVSLLKEIAPESGFLGVPLLCGLELIRRFREHLYEGAAHLAQNGNTSDLFRVSIGYPCPPYGEEDTQYGYVTEKAREIFGKHPKIAALVKKLYKTAISRPVSPADVRRDVEQQLWIMGMTDINFLRNEDGSRIEAEK